MNELKSQLVLAKSKDGKYIMLGETKETGSWFSFPKDNNTSSQFEKGDRVNVAFKVNGTFKNITSIDKAGQQSAPAYTPKSYPKAEEQWLPDPAPAAVSAYGTVGKDETIKRLSLMSSACTAVSHQAMNLSQAELEGAVVALFRVIKAEIEK